MKTKINQQNAQINSGLIHYWSITPTCFGPSVEAIIREFEILESYKAIVLYWSQGFRTPWWWLRLRGRNMLEWLIS